MKGLEPPRLTAPDPKSGAAANYATSAKTDCESNKNLLPENGENLTQNIKRVAYLIF